MGPFINVDRLKSNLQFVWAQHCFQKTIKEVFQNLTIGPWAFFGVMTVPNLNPTRQIAIRTDQSSNTLEMTMYFNNEDFEPGWCLSWGLCLLTSWPSSWRRRRVRPRSRRRTCTSCSSRHRSARRRRQKAKFRFGNTFMPWCQFKA